MRSLWFGKIVLFFTVIFVLFILFFLTGLARAENQQESPQNQQSPIQEKEAIIFPSNSPPYFNYFAPPRQRRFSQNYPRYYPRYSYQNYNQNYQYPRYYPQYYNALPRYYLGPYGPVLY